MRPAPILLGLLCITFTTVACSNETRSTDDSHTVGADSTDARNMLTDSTRTAGDVPVPVDPADSRSTADLTAQDADSAVQADSTTTDTADTATWPDLPDTDEAGATELPCNPGCPAGLECGTLLNDCGNEVTCGKCVPPAVCGHGEDNICAVPTPLPYPAKTAYQIKGIQPDHWPDKNEIAGNGAGSVAMNLVWYGWEPQVKAPPCGENQEEFDGHCFAVSDGVDGEIRDYTDMGVVVTAILYGVPDWARQNIACSPITAGFEVFCAPDDAADYARFAGMLAFRYNGLNGNGRIADFVIHNEVNSNDWFDIGCGQGTPCDKDKWISVYADNYAAAYDAITLQQPFAKVLMSFTHHFDVTFDEPAAPNPTLSVKTFVTEMEKKLGDRDWRVAYHPYAPNLLSPLFSPDDLPKVTYGNIGVIVGWLMAAFPQHPHAWDVELTESGVNSLPPQSSPEAQSDGICRSLYNVVATPGLSNYIYHRMKDHPVEVAAGIGLGLVTDYGDFKPSWVTWALSNRIDLDPPKLSCGFENLPHTRLVRGYKAGRGHWASTRLLPDGFVEEQVYRLHHDQQPGTVMLYECMQGQDSFITTKMDCEGQQPMGPLGFISTEPVNGGVALYRCHSSAAGDHMISPDPNCESYDTEELLGYAQPW